MTPILGTMASQISGHLATPNNYESIATTTLSSSSGTITFSSIPATYQHLQIRGIYLGSGEPYIRFNSDTGSNYSYHILRGDGTTVYAQGVANWTYMPFGYYDTAVTNVPANFIIDILDYANTNKYKTNRSLSGLNTNAAQYEDIRFNSGNWRNTAAVSTITISGMTFGTYSSFALYGVK